MKAHVSVLGLGHGARTAAVVWTQAAPHAMVSLGGFTEHLGTVHRSASLQSAVTPMITGRIDPRSVRLRGLRVSFTEDGRHHTLRLAG